MKNTSIRYCLTVCCILVCNVLAVAQTRPAYGVFGDYNLNMYKADFRTFPNVPSCCPLYEDGSGGGFSLGLFYELPLAEKLRLALRAGYSTRGGVLLREENVVVSGNVLGVFQHSVDVSLADVGIEPLAQYNLFGSLWLNLGARVAYVTTQTFSQKESIVSPSDGVFSNGSSTRNEINDQPIPSSSALFAGVLAGVSYDVPLNANATVILAPEVLYCLGITPVVSDLDWTTNSIRFGLALKLSPQQPGGPIERIEEKQNIDSIPVVRPVAVDSVGTERDVAQTLLAVGVLAKGVEANGEEKPTVTLRVEEFSSVLMTPLLNYVFFDENSAALPSRYRFLNSEETNGFDEKGVNSIDRLSTYYHLLNIVGKRLRQNPSATITLVGCNADVEMERGNLALSTRRAESVKEYLVKTWGIADVRIKTESRNLPEKAAFSQSAEGYQENRRVEILTSNTEITAPIITKDTLRKANPPILRFYPRVENDVPLSKWILTAEQNGMVVKRFEGSRDVPASLDWTMDQEGSHPRSEGSMVYSLQVTDTNNRSETSSGVIAVEQTTIHRKKIERRGDKEINRYSLILFEVRSSDITSTNRPIIDLIRKNIAPNSTVIVAGYTDRLGDPRANQTIAEDRAKTTASALRLQGDSVSISGQGNADTYNPDLPEGRLYTRTVDVVIETPVKE